MKKKVDPLYQKKIEDIKAEGEKYAADSMKAVYAEQKVVLDELHNIISKAYVDHGKDGVLILTSAQKKALTQLMEAKLKNMGLKLGQAEVEKITSLLGEVYSASYYKNAFVLESGLKADIKFFILKPEFVDAAVNAKYKGEFFSDRIWANKAEMLDKLQRSIIGAMKGDVYLDKVVESIAETFNVTAYESQRLVRTETARVQSQATDDIAQATGVSEQMFSATLDGKTNPEDASFDGKVYGVDDSDKPEIPLHPNCRCCYINVPYAGWSPSARKDNESGKIIAYTNYGDWAKDKGIGSGNNG